MLDNETVLVTGATGLIGKTLVNDLINNNANVIVVVRDINKAKLLFGGHVQYIVGDVRTVDLSNVSADYVIHAASQTSSRGFIQSPVETISVAINGTKNLLEFAKTQNNLKRFVYLSTMEVYGTPLTDEKITENHGTNLDPMVVRCCYPESKRMCENLCASYASEFGVATNVLRLTQTFGAGVEYNDNRVFAEFARCALEGKDIVLKTKGETKRSYLYIEDAIKAIFCILKKGIPGEAYNVANEKTYCSIYDMAELVANKVAKGNIHVRIEEGESDRGFAPTLHMNLDTTKIRTLGWKPTMDLYGMYEALIDDWKKSGL